MVHGVNRVVAGGDRCMAGWEAGQPCSKGPLHTLAFAALTICSPSLFEQPGGHTVKHRKNKHRECDIILQPRLKIVYKESKEKNTAYVRSSVEVKTITQLLLMAMTATAIGR